MKSPSYNTYRDYGTILHVCWRYTDVMRNATVLALFICTVVVVGSAAQTTPQLLSRAARCLAVENFLPSSRATRLTFGYFLDEKSYAPDKEIYVVMYAAPTRSNGLVFAIVFTEHQGLQDFNIQNNASFVLSKDGPHGVDFVDPPLGGTWTQEHLASAIRQIEKQPRFAISVKDLSAADASIHCESYADPQPGKAEPTPQP